jgi:Zn-dependent protease with chaperone function
MDSKKQLLPDDFRLAKEKIVLFASLTIVILLLLLVIGINPLIPVILILFSAIWIKIGQKQLLGNTIKVSENNIPRIFNASKIVAKKISMKRPDVFVKQSPELNAYAIGVFGDKSVVLHSALVKIMNDDELLSILGHEFSHIKCGHTVWNTIIGTKNLVQIPLLSKCLEFLFLYWSRIAEYTADRGGLISCRNLKATTTSFIKLAVGKTLASEINVDDFLNQLEKERVATQMAGVLLTHPYLADRIMRLSDFYSSDIYKNICNNTFKREDHKTNETLKNIIKLIKNKKFGQKIKIDVITNEIKKIIKDLNISKKEKVKKGFDQKAPENKKQKNREENTENEKIVSGLKLDLKIKKDPKETIDVIKDISLIYAVLDEELAKVNRLISFGIDPNTKDNTGDTPLHLAVQLENHEIVKCLLKAGAQINKKNNGGDTPLSIAESNNYKDLIKLMLENKKTG